MKTIAIRFSENFAPDIGTVAAHQKIIDSLGYCWYGKLGSPISNNVAEDILKNKDPRVLLIHSGKQERYWMCISEVTRDLPPLNEIPDYYRDASDKFKSWFKVKAFTKAPSGIMSRCVVISSKSTLSEASKHSMSPYFIIDFEESNL